MTPTETANILRQFNEWRRGDEDIPQFDPREIGEAIDAAVEMIGRLEAAESYAVEQARLNGMGASREAALMAKLEAAEKTKSDWLRANAPGGWIDALRLECDYLLARIEAMEKQGPVGKFIQHPSHGMWEQDGYSDNPDAKPLYLAPGAKGE